MTIKDSIMLYVPQEGVFIHFEEGSGDNLLKEDREEGYVDYIDWTSYRIEEDWPPTFKEEDGGMILLKTLYRECSDEEIVKELLYACDISETAEIVPIAVDM